MRTPAPQSGPRAVAARDWGSTYDERMDAELWVLERGGLTEEMAERASALVDRKRPPDEWGYFRHVCFMFAADRIIALREVARAERAQAPNATN